MICAEKFRFVPATHTYFLGETKLVGVSEAIQAAGLKDFSRIPPNVLEHARQRGIAVHAACHFLDEQDLDWSTVSPEVEPYVRAWESFKKDTGVVVTERETPRYNATLGFAGTPDRLVKLGENAGTLDLKTYRPDAVTGVQLAAYSYLAYGPQASWGEKKRWGLWLKNDRKYSLTEYTDRGDEDVFLACLKFAKFKGGNK